MENKKYIVTKDIKINKDYTIKKGKHLILENSLDGIIWECIEDNTKGCPFFEMENIKEVV